MEKVKQQIELWEQTPTTSYVELPSGIYIIDGERITLSGYNNKHIVDTPKSIQKEITKKVITHYASTETQDTISVEDYNKQNNLLENKGYYCEDEYYTKFYNLDDEFAYRKFMKKWEAVRVETTELHDMEIVLHEDLGQPNKFIVPMKKLNGNLKDTQYQYLRSAHIVHCVTEALKVFDKKLKHDGKLEFSKVDGSFLTIMIKGLKKYERGANFVTDTLEGSLVRYNTVEEDINKIIKIYYLSKISAESVVSADELIKTLSDVYTEVSRIDSKQRTADVKVNTLTKIKTLQDKLEKLVLAKGNK